jgi:lipopolysaccharide/colanic/teichoic acid biosynthesis glycosyltransferase/glycosyltransferase involved in cell wall biosynthesis
MARPDNPRYSVVVPAFQAAETIGDCLTALNQQTVPAGSYEVIVVDDGSTDGTEAIARAAGVIVARQEHAGAAAARNCGAALARGELLLFTDADCAPVPGWIAALAAPFCDPEVAGAKGTYLSRQRSKVARFTQIEYEDRYDRMAGAERIDFIDTYSAAYRRSIFLANGGFDPRFLINEDQEFSFRLAEKGYKLVFAPDAQVYHRHNATVTQYARRKFKIGMWKVRVTRQHPTQVVKDSHTPGALKAQLLIAAVSLAMTVVNLGITARRKRPWWPGWFVWLGLLTAFDISAVPFYSKIARRDPQLVPPALPMMWVRALALGFGFAAGLVRFRKLGDERPPLTVIERAAKRLIDLTLTLALLPFVAPLMGAIALAITLDSRGPVLFRQVRTGQKGQPFEIFKFRSMVDGAEHALDRLVDVDTLIAPAFKIPNDPRVTRVGRFLRRWSLDELPQLLNVLRGEMSLVGPRPEEARVVARYTDDQRRRLAVKPGITGPMQINGRGDLPFEDRLRLELDYIENYSLARDLRILARTLPAVLDGAGAY